MSNNFHGKKKFNRGGGGGGGGRNGGGQVDKGNFDELMVGFIIMTDQNREKNCVTDANNFLIPIIEELFPNAYQRVEGQPQQHLRRIEQQLVKRIKPNQEVVSGIPIPSTDNDNDSPAKDEHITEEVVQTTSNEGLQQEASEVKAEEGAVEAKEDNQVQVESDGQQKDEAEAGQAEEGEEADQQGEEEEEEEEEAEGDNDDEGENTTETGTKVVNEQAEGIQQPAPIRVSANDILEKELQDLKSQKDKLLYNVNTDVKCTVFLKVNSKLMDNIDVHEVVDKVMQRVHVERTALTRFCHRMFPAEFAFRASEEGLKKYLPILIERRFNIDAPSSWMLECKSRNNNKFNRKKVLDIVQDVVPKQHFVDYKNPFFTIVVDICHNLMCLSVLRNYNEYKKYSVKVNPQLNNNKDFQSIPHIKQFKQPQHHREFIPVTEEQREAEEKRQEEIRAQLRAEQISGINNEEDEEIDLI